MSYHYSKSSKQLFQYLEDLGIEQMSEQEKRNIDKIVEEYPSLEVAKREIDLLFAINRALITSYCKVSVENMLNLSKSIDVVTLVKLYSVYENIKDKCKDEIVAFNEFRKVVVEIIAVDGIVNKEITQMMDTTFKKSLELKNSLYMTMIDKEKADTLFENCKRRSKLFLSECESRNLEEIILCLKKNFKLKDDELVNISKRCASFFISSSAAKINNLNLRIEEFKNYIRKQEVKMSTALEIDKLLKKDFKGLLRDASSVAILNPENINKTLKFLMGDNLGKLTPTSKELYDVKGDFTPYQLAKIYNYSITSLSVSVEKIKDVCENVSAVYKRTYNEELDLSKFINGNNFSSIAQITKEDYFKDKKINEIFEMLSMFISSKDMENLLKNDLSFLIAPTNAVKSSLKEAVLISNNKDELRYNVLKKIRNHFDIYEKTDFSIKKESNTHNETSLNRISIKDITEEEIKGVLTRLDANSEDIDLWSKKWDKEEKEYRDLEVQIELEELISQIDDAQGFLNIDVIDPEEILEEVIAIKEMYGELKENYHKIVDDKKLNKSLRDLAGTAYSKLEELRNGINYHFDSLVSLYTEKLQSSNANLEDKLRLLDKSNKRNARRIELDEIIKHKVITVEKMRDLNEMAIDIEKFLSHIEKSIDIIKEREKEANKMVSKYFVFLKSEARENAITKGFNGDNGDNRKLSVLFAMFIYSLEVDGLIDNADEVLGHKYNLKKVPYKVYKQGLNRKEREFTDEIYKLYVDNMEFKAVMRKKIDECLAKYGVYIKEDLMTNDKLTMLIKILEDAKAELKEDVKIVKERSRYDQDQITVEIASLEAEKDKLHSLIEIYCDQIEYLRKEKIIM